MVLNQELGSPCAVKVWLILKTRNLVLLAWTRTGNQVLSQELGSSLGGYGLELEIGSPLAVNLVGGDL